MPMQTAWQSESESTSATISNTSAPHAANGKHGHCPGIGLNEQEAKLQPICEASFDTTNCCPEIALNERTAELQSVTAHAFLWA